MPTPGCPTALANMMFQQSQLQPSGQNTGPRLCLMLLLFNNSSQSYCRWQTLSQSSNSLRRYTQPALISEARVHGNMGTHKYPETPMSCSAFRSLPLEQQELKQPCHSLVAWASTITSSRQWSCLLFRSLPPCTPSLASGAAGKLFVPGRCRGANWC